MLSPQTGKATCNKQQGYMQQATRNMQQATCNMQQATCNMKQATCNKRHATCNMQRQCDVAGGWTPPHAR